MRLGSFIVATARLHARNRMVAIIIIGIPSSTCTRGEHSKQYQEKGFEKCKMFMNISEVA